MKYMILKFLKRILKKPNTNKIVVDGVEVEFSPQKVHIYEINRSKADRIYEYLKTEGFL
jgi:hypothetical protein